MLLLLNGSLVNLPANSTWTITPEVVAGEPFEDNFKKWVFITGSVVFHLRADTIETIDIISRKCLLGRKEDEKERLGKELRDGIAKVGEQISKKDLASELLDVSQLFPKE